MFEDKIGSMKQKLDNLKSTINSDFDDIDELRDSVGRETLEEAEVEIANRRRMEEKGRNLLDMPRQSQIPAQASHSTIERPSEYTEKKADTSKSINT